MTMQSGNEDFDYDREAELVKRLKQVNPADAEAWQTFTAMFQPRLRGTIVSTLRKYHLPIDRLDDIEQKTWMTAFTKMAEFELRGKNSLKNWLLTIQYNHVRNLSRQPNPISFEAPLNAEIDLTLADQLADDQSPDPEQEIISNETRREIWSALELALGELSLRDQEIVSRRLISKEAIEILALDYNLKKQSVYQIISGTKKKLRSYLLAPDLFFRVSDRTDKESTAWQK